MIFKNSGVKS